MDRSARNRIFASTAAASTWSALASVAPVASFASVASFAVFAALGACGGSSRAPVGVSTAAPGGASTSVARDAGAARGPAGIPPDFRTNLTKINRARFVSNGHAGGRYEVDVYANAAGKSAALSASGEVLVGARLVKEHFERVADGVQPGPVMMMEKMERGFDPDHGDWAYVVVNSAGAQVQNGRVEACAGCHDDAPHDHVFRINE